MAALARWCLRRRAIVIALWLAAFAGVAAAAAVTGSAYSNDYDIPGTDSSKASALLERRLPDRAGDSDTIVWHTKDGAGTVRAPGVERRMTAALRQVADLPGVASVTGPYGSGDTSRISADQHTAYATVVFRKPAADLGEAEVRRVLDTARSAALGARGLEVEMGGAGAGLTERTGSAHLSEAIGVGVAAVVLFLAFGSLVATLLPIATALIGVGTAYAAIRLLGHAMTIADFAPMLGMLIGLGVGIDYALFIVTRHRRGLRRGLSIEQAAQRAVVTSGRAVVFAGATVCLALLGMLVLRLSFLNGVAVAAALTVALTVAASLTLLPALLGLIGMRALSRRERRRLAERGPESTATKGLCARWAICVERRPKLLGATAAALIALLALPTFSLHLGTSDQGNGPSASTTRRAYDLLADGFGPGFNGPLTLMGSIDGADDRMAFTQLPKVLRTIDGVASVSAADLGGSGDTGVITVVPETAPQSRATSDLVGRLRAEVLPRAEEGSSLRVYVGGLTAGYDDFAAVIVGKLPLFVGVVVALGCVLLLLAFRSIGIPIKAAVMNVAAVASSFGVVVAIFQWGWGSELLGLGRAGPIEPFLPVIMVSVLFGLSMDYQVFLVSRMYEEWRRTRDNRTAVRVGLAETSRVINSAAVIMIAVFSAFVLSDDRIIAMFGIGLAAAVALDAFVLRTLLVPALMHLLGGANWWLPSWLERLLPKISIEAEGGGEGRASGPVPVPVSLPGQSGSGAARAGTERSPVP
ncbi:MMPL family transporter [Streptomyces melanosporofaciens]|uniref:Putative drug exporter of the RND superfamily n=1 Tax=Streptomyces melanosporofaciens TaxID=67327 RepID=A0A1H4U920_STRMJ|nr:MMPL family transporter [Streptomyces melanosporofaciens]SEC65090.1 putative drug exporter of the RND superfamily [Streptomyces melanosporofaciens]